MSRIGLIKLVAEKELKYLFSENKGNFLNVLWLLLESHKTKFKIEQVVKKYSQNKLRLQLEICFNSYIERIYSIKYRMFFSLRALR